MKRSCSRNRFHAQERCKLKRQTRPGASHAPSYTSKVRAIRHRRGRSLAEHLIPDCQLTRHPDRRACHAPCFHRSGARPAGSTASASTTSHRSLRTDARYSGAVCSRARTITPVTFAAYSPLRSSALFDRHPTTAPSCVVSTPSTIRNGSPGSTAARSACTRCVGGCLPAKPRSTSAGAVYAAYDPLCASSASRRNGRRQFSEKRLGGFESKMEVDWMLATGGLKLHGCCDVCVTATTDFDDRLHGYLQEAYPLRN